MDNLNLGNCKEYFPVRKRISVPHFGITSVPIWLSFLDNLKFEDLDISFFNYGARITYKKNEIGQLGEVSNEMKKSFDIKQDEIFQ